VYILSYEAKDVLGYFAFSSAVPNRRFADPWGPETRFSGVRNAIVDGESLRFLGCAFLKRTEFCESLQMLLPKRTLSRTS